MSEVSHQDATQFLTQPIEGYTVRESRRISHREEESTSRTENALGELAILISSLNEEWIWCE